MTRSVVLTAEAEAQLKNQLDYLIDRGASQAASDLDKRFWDFLQHRLAVFPRTGHYLPDRDIFETWISRTKLIVWFRFDDDVVEILTVWHSSQDRHAHRD